MKSLLISLFICLSTSIFAQNISVTGHIFDNKHKPLPGATVYFFTAANPSKKLGNVANADGSFNVTGLSATTYTMQISFVGFNNLTQTVTITVNNQNLGNFQLREQTFNLKEVTAIGRESRAVQLNDTLRYNADAFKTIQGANVETLISKMPGIVVDNAGTVQAQGETVKKVLVDGKPFFDGDPTLALRNLPAEIVQNIEVFDKKSEQAEFTGFDDGNSTKTINVITRRGMQTGVFGKIVGGIGLDQDNKTDYQGSAAINLFNGNRRITLLGMSNNINQQNFSQEDLAGVMSGGGRGGRGGLGGSRGGGSGNFVVGGQSGLTNTNAGGFNYSDKWGSKIDVTAGYFFNMTTNNQNQSSTGTYFAPDSLGRIRSFDDVSTSNSTNYNHRFNMKLDYKLDDNNSFTFLPSISFQKNISNSTTGSNTYWNGIKESATSTINSSDVLANNLAASLLYRHKFSKQGRTISTSVDWSKNENNNDGHNITTSTIPTKTPNRTIDNNSNGYSYGGNVTYTEPLSTNAILQASYRISYNHRDIDKRTYNYFTQALDTSLSNLYNSDYLTQRAGLGYRLRNNNGFMLMANLDFQHASLTGDETFPKLGTTNIGFNSLLPTVMANYKINAISSLRFSLNSSTSAPSIQQLQNVIDDSNPAAVTGGNANLKQQVSNRAMIRYTLTPLSGQTLILMLSAGNTLNYIGNNVLYNASDKPITLFNGYLLNSKAQYSYPVNLSGNWNVNAMVTYGFPLDFIKSNLNLSGNFGYNKLPSIYYNVKQETDNYTITPKIILGSNISDKIDFTLSYASSFNIARNNVATSANDTYLNQTAAFKIDWIFWDGFTLQNVMTYQNYTGMSSGYSQNYFLWNASVGKKILKGQRGEIKLQAYDLLRQNKSLVRNVTANYYEDVNSNVLKPFVMLSFTYDLRNFKGQQYQKKQQDQQKQRRQQWEGGDRPSGMPHGGGAPQGEPSGPPPMM